MIINKKKVSGNRKFKSVPFKGAVTLETQR